MGVFCRAVNFICGFPMHTTWLVVLDLRFWKLNYFSKVATMNGANLNLKLFQQFGNEIARNGG